MKTQVRIAIWLLVASLTLGIVAAGCSQGQKAASPSGPYTYPMWADFTGPSASMYERDFIPTIKDYVNSVNDAGGIGGRKIEFRWYDSKNAAAEGPPLWAKIVSEVNPPIMYGLGTSPNEGARSFIDKDKIPVVSANTSLKQVYPPGYIFTTSIGYSDEFANIAKYVVKNWKKPGKPKLAILILEHPAGRAVDPGVNWVKANMASDLDLVVDYLPMTATDVSPYLNRLKSAKPDWVHMMLLAALTGLVLDEATNLGLKDSATFSLVNWTSMYGVKPYTKTPNALDGLTQFTHISPSTRTGSKGVEEANARWQKYHGDAGRPYGAGDYGLYSLPAIVTVKALQAVVAEKGWAAATKENLYSYLQTHEVETGGLTGPLKWSETKRTGPTKMNIVAWKDGKEVVQADWFDIFEIPLEELQKYQ